jgi:nifR3 family TIM-barrel protein
MQENGVIARLAEPLTIGPVTAPNRVLLAPMSGVSDRAFRSLAAEAGAGIVVSEMVASEALVHGHPETLIRAERAGKGPHMVQLAGRETHWMAEGARAATDAGADIIDINMGCPAKKVTSGYSGSALMRDLDHAQSLIEATMNATPLPVTLKMRLGWDDRTINAAELARRAEQTGVRMIVVHGRTRCQFYTGRADWAAIAHVKATVSIPVIANGDLESVDELDEMLRLSGADGVMVGRGAYGRPWFPGELAEFARTGRRPKELSRATLIEHILRHFEGIVELYGPIFGVRVARKHIGWYCDRHGLTQGPAGAATRARLMAETDAHAVMRILGALRSNIEAIAA